MTVSPSIKGHALGGPHHRATGGFFLWLDAICETIAAMTPVPKGDDERGEWAKRYQNHVVKLKTGGPAEIAIAVRTFEAREVDKGLSAGEKRMLARAQQDLGGR